jgi:hypothetical protein
LAQEKYEKYRFFICYTRDSAEDLATHLRESLEKRRITAFLDLMDIPKKFRKTDKWWKYRDEALCNSETVLFVITHGFEESNEVIKEMSLAFDEGKDLIFLRHKDRGPKIVIQLKDKEINLGDYNQISFDTKHDLLRKVLSTIEEEKIKPPYTPSIEKRKNKNDKVEIVPPRKIITRKNVLLPDGVNITKLSIDDSLLDSIHEQAHRKAVQIYHDAQLSQFTIQVFPFAEIGSRVNIYLDFYSKWADKRCMFRYDKVTSQVEHCPPDKSPKYDSDREVFTSLPWKESPHWRQILNRVYAKIGPFAPASMTVYYLRTWTPRPQWRLSFEDNFSGNEYAFTWDGKGLDKNSVRQLR